MYDCKLILLCLQKQTFQHQSTHQHIYMPVSIRKKYHKTWGALGSDKKLAQNKVCRNTYNYLLLSTGNIMEIAHLIVAGENEAGVDLVLIQPFLLYYVNHVFLKLTSIFKQNLHQKRIEVFNQNKVNLSLTFTQRLGH